ncbi:pre-rRNA-processing protein TSR1 homolog [Pomacea canaliculata]|uniref:pre-rRNA-processing protein TSR1 homolog n=1 Tax=Pomacea canaliculata TaxID=400727 RepID=UPI000D73D394|nr:pre-rRNA-processing protein TSR1 homolog [Pomacea canaliculata]
MAADEAHSHRPGVLKQQNKSHKHGKHRSKGELSRESHGRVNIKTVTKKAKQVQRKNERRIQAKQLRKLKRGEVIEMKRRRGGQYTPPHFTVIVKLCSSVNTDTVMELLQEGAVDEDQTPTVLKNEQGALHIRRKLCNFFFSSSPVFLALKQRMSFFIPQYGNLHALLDSAKIADSVLFVVSPEAVIDNYGNSCLKCLMGQGLSSSLFTCHGLSQLPQKKAAEARKAAQKVLEKSFPCEKLRTLDTRQDALLILRQLIDAKVKPVYYREMRPYLFAESIAFEAETDESVVGTLKVSGYLRGEKLSVNRLIYISGWDNYQISQIDSIPDPYPLVIHSEKQNGSSMNVDDGTKVLAHAEPDKQESLQSEAEPDVMQNEQTWPTESEILAAEASALQRKKLPSGVSEYQQMWINESDEDDSDDDDDDNSDEDMAPVDVESDDDSKEEEEDSEALETMTVTEGGDAEKYDAAMDLDAEQKFLEKVKEERQHVMFPDEVDTPVDVPARVRFARYQGLQSFRTSPWCQNENLPIEYGRIFRFDNIKLLKKSVRKQEVSDAVQPGQYITIHISNVPRTFMESHSPNTPVVLFGMLPHEQKMTVMHFVIKRPLDFTDPVRSKEELVFQVGYRRFSACPIFSQHATGDKHKFERFLPQNDACVASVYAPLTFAPAPVLVFQQANDGHHQLVASGSVLSASPDRIIVKRIVLSGHPFKINKRSAVIRLMFFNREDILWFKKIELRTKWGRRGHILEPLGTHGHMKCVFNGQLKSQDTVLMNLYKRMYCKWTYNPRVPCPSAPSNMEEEEEGQAFHMFD